MTGVNYETRLCQGCGLRYPLVENHPFGERCPSCLGTTTVLAKYQIDRQAAALPMKSDSRLETLLDNIRSAWNVGSIFRTADGLGVRKLYLCGITPTPESASVTKTSLGAEDTVKWEYSRDAVNTAKRLKGAGYRLLALEHDKRAIPVREFLPKGREMRSKGKLLIILGNEVTGIDPGLLDLSDEIIQIPMRGKKKSFNVEVAYAIATYLLCSPDVLDYL